MLATSQEHPLCPKTASALTGNQATVKAVQFMSTNRPLPITPTTPPQTTHSVREKTWKDCGGRVGHVQVHLQYLAAEVSLFRRYTVNMYINTYEFKLS